MRVLIFGDIYGRIGRKAFLKEFPILKEQYNPDFVVVNVDNISSGRGVIMDHAILLLDAGVDVLTGGDHIFDNLSSVEEYIQKPNSRLLGPANFPYNSAGKGYTVIEKSGMKLGIIHLLGTIFMNHQAGNPFHAADLIIGELQNKGVSSIIIDFHREASSELYGMAMYLEGRISAIFGTHTHIQTNDAHILPGGTALITDVGMNGPLYSVIGAEFQSVKKRFLSGIQKGKIEQCLGSDYVIGAIVLDIDDISGKCMSIETLKSTGILK